jgi:hypothetical protein
MCLGYWSQLGHVKDKDIISATVLPEIEGEEQELKAGWDAIGDV